jgi:glycerate 2-kinase
MVCPTVRNAMKHNLRRDAKAILMAALAAADPTAAVEQVLRAREDLDRYERIFVVGAGKAGGTMARAVEQLLKGRISAGCINVKDGDTAKTRVIETRPCGHPVPDERGLDGARRIAEICAEAGENDLVICLLSGGASALMPYPAPPITLGEKRETTTLLLASGASIHEINAVRKHLSGIKGGQLARLAAPARVLSLILSDVVGDDLDVIGSGPTAPDASTFQDAFAVLKKYELRDRVPARVRERLRNGARETPKAGDPLFENVENIIVGSNQKSLESAARAAKDLGYRTIILSSTIEGETKDVARMHAAIARQIRTYEQPARPPACVISGGETTVTMLNGSAGKGGRNQEFALAAAIDAAGLEDILILSAGTDGTDGPTDAAGAVADGTTVARANSKAFDALRDHDAYPLFEELGDLIITGSTGTNVMDLHLILVA